MPKVAVPPLRVNNHREEEQARSGHQSLSQGPIPRQGTYFTIQGGFAKCYEFTNLANNKKYAAKIVEKATLTRSKAKEKVKPGLIS